MTSYVEAPTPAGAGMGVSVFLAGGVTHCPDWQRVAARELLAAGLTVFNPRRREFPIDDPAQTPVQIAWEYRHLQVADMILFWFPPCDAALTTQPISMYELGFAAASGRRMVVGADPGYPRVADVYTQLAHARPELTIHATLGATLRAAREAAA
ncbi:nucleoside 2-deoxyribosyltransferase domain-containing protein [Streptomyces sp. NBRC 109706]|uniref:nucleoside 2-deoxyribosyltransferase domain-containing protein n=1 Tax=Streptomyces sp. NBRC 109706 TaxID=1550035 RepID=UPI0007847CBD|nr:nucleoside 2-deoxyribosyltransferase domain-containing protein [Streptomyces sp. NBRC 109706]